VCVLSACSALSLSDRLLPVWKAVADVPCNLQRVVIIVQRVIDINQSSHIFYNTLWNVANDTLTYLQRVAM